MLDSVRAFLYRGMPWMRETECSRRCWESVRVGISWNAMLTAGMFAQRLFTLMLEVNLCHAGYIAYSCKIPGQWSLNKSDNNTKNNVIMKISPGLSLLRIDSQCQRRIVLFLPLYSDLNRLWLEKRSVWFDKVNWFQTRSINYMLPTKRRYTVYSRFAWYISAEISTGCRSKASHRSDYPSTDWLIDFTNRSIRRWWSFSGELRQWQWHSNIKGKNYVIYT